MRIKPTPGPWKIYKEESATECWYPKGLLYVGPCIIGTECESITPQNYVDAHLIAAAPELLEALYTALPHIKDGSKQSLIIRAAIAKAEGKE